MFEKDGQTATTLPYLQNKVSQVMVTLAFFSSSEVMVFNSQDLKVAICHDFFLGIQLRFNEF